MEFSVDQICFCINLVLVTIIITWNLSRILYRLEREEAVPPPDTRTIELVVVHVGGGCGGVPSPEDSPEHPADGSDEGAPSVHDPDNDPNAGQNIH